MKKPNFWEKAKKYLILNDKELGKIIRKYPKDFLFTKSDPFYTLSRSIIGQQISVKAAQAVWEKYENKLKNITPKNTLSTHHMTLKSCGLSRQKISYLKSLSKAFNEQRINPNKWNNYTDEQIIDELTLIKGIGRWTAEMFLIFNLCRPDIFPLDDLGLIKGICNCYNLNYPISKEHALKLSLKWKPYRSVATWYFWRSIDDEPLQY